MNYVRAKINKYRLDTIGSMYTADGIRLISENTAKIVGGSALKFSLPELQEELKKPPDTRTGEEIKQGMIQKMKKFREEEGL